VECNTGDWMSGTVVGQWWREPRSGKVVPYQIKLDYGPTIYAPADKDGCIRKITGLLAVGQIPCTILTGFLGAGKTTLLNYILSAQHGKKYAVIENEFGEVAIDNQLLDQAVGKQDTIESITVLDNGCLCCTVRDDLVTAMQNIVQKVQERHAAGIKDAILDGILIETTGMADPGPIINTFGKDDVVKKYCKIDGVLTVVDCKHFLTQLHRERSPDAVNESAQQVGFADKVLLNKIDACTKGHIDETKEAIRSINAVVPIRECSLSTKPDQVPLAELLAIEAFDMAKLLTQQASQEEVNLVAAIEGDEHGSGHESGHESGHAGGHGSGHGGEGSAGHDDNGHGHSGGHDGETCGSDCADESHGHDAGRGHGHGHGSRHDIDVKSMVLEKEDAPLNMHRFQHWLGTLLDQRSVDLYRYKGVLAAGKPNKKVELFILQGVHDMPELIFSGQWPEGKRIKTQVVIIGRKLDTQRYRNEFAECFD